MKTASQLPRRAASRPVSSSLKGSPVSAYACPLPPATAGRRRRPARLTGWLAGGVLVALLAVAFTVALWPASQADKARDDGERLGTAVNALYLADTPADVDSALADVRAAAGDARDHAGDAV